MKPEKSQSLAGSEKIEAKDVFTEMTRLSSLASETGDPSDYESLWFFLENARADWPSLPAELPGEREIRAAIGQNVPHLEEAAQRWLQDHRRE